MKLPLDVQTNTNPTSYCIFRRTVYDKMTGKDIVLKDEDVALIQRIQDGRYPETTFDPYEPYVDFFTHEKMIHPVTRRPEHKRSFIPSLLEKEKVCSWNNWTDLIFYHSLS